MNVSNRHVESPRSHSTIIREIGAARIHEALSARPELAPISLKAVERWRDRDAIASGYWMALTSCGFATLEELAAYAESRKAAAPSPADDTQA